MALLKTVQGDSDVDITRRIRSGALVAEEIRKPYVIAQSTTNIWVGLLRGIYKCPTKASDKVVH